MELPPLGHVNAESAAEASGSSCAKAFRTNRGWPTPIRRLQRLPARHPLSTASENKDARSITVEAPAGAAVSLLPASAGDLLPVPVTSRDGRPETDANKCHVEITWTAPAPGRVALPLRPPSIDGVRAP